MPTYANNTRKKITFPNMCYLEFYPGEVKELRYHLPYEDLGLTLISEQPYVSKGPTGMGNYMAYFEEEILAGESKKYKFPYCEAFHLSIEVTVGKIYVYYGDSDAAVLVDTTHYQVTPVAWQKVPWVIVECIEGAKLTIKAEDFVGPMRIGREQ